MRILTEVLLEKWHLSKTRVKEGREPGEYSGKVSLAVRIAVVKAPRWKSEVIPRQQAVAPVALAP